MKLYSKKRLQEFRKSIARRITLKHFNLIGLNPLSRIKGFLEYIYFSETYLSQLLNSTGDGIIGINKDCNCFFINKSALNMLGFNRKEFINNNIHHLIHCKDTKGNLLEPSECKIIKVIKTAKGIRISDEVFWKKDNTYIDVEYTAYPLIKFNKVEGVVVAFNNISNLKREVKERNEFLSLVGHELKTPLTTIKAYTQLLKKKLPPEKKENLYITNLENQITKLNELIEDLLDVSRIQLNRFYVKLEEGRIDQLIENIVNNIQLTTPKKIIFKKEEIKNVYLFDKLRIEQVLLNLISNAMKYSPSSNKIVVSFYEKGNKIIISVKDFGIGIEEENLTKIFEKYFREISTESEFHGLGLGLYVCSEIISRHKGEIWVKSRKGKGSTFFFSLPAR